MNKVYKRRYPGVKPFEPTERGLFFGRDRDIEDLLDMVYLEKLVVLFGKSGYGKSSLLNAGILPGLEEGVVPVLIRPGAYVEGQTRAPLETLRLKLEETLVPNPDASFLDSLDLPDTLWLYLKRCQSQQKQRLLLIFDQFEEFFTHPAPAQTAFKEQLAELLYTEVPQAARNQVEMLSSEQQALLAAPFEVKALMAIRADRLSLLDSMKDSLPAILHKRYELRGLGTAQAREAIVRPAQVQGDRFVSKTFTYSDNALQKIIGDLSRTGLTARNYIEAFQLQILCQYVENKVIERKTTGIQIQESDLPDIANIYEAYYKRQIARLEATEQELAQHLIEDGLLFEDESTGEARRLSMDADVLIRQFNASKKLLEDLENTFLLRRETNTLGGFNYEIIHDTLIAPIRRAKIARKLKEDKIESERKRVEAERKAREEEVRRVIAEKRRRLAKRWAITAAVGFILALGAMSMAVILWQKASEQKKRIEEAHRGTVELVEKYEREAEKRKEAEKVNELARIRSLKNAITNFIADGSPASFGLARDSLHVLEKIAPNDADLPKLKSQIK